MTPDEIRAITPPLFAHELTSDELFMQAQFLMLNEIAAQIAELNATIGRVNDGPQGIYRAVMDSRGNPEIPSAIKSKRERKVEGDNDWA